MTKTWGGKKQEVVEGAQTRRKYNKIIKCLMEKGSGLSLVGEKGEVRELCKRKQKEKDKKGGKDGDRVRKKKNGKKRMRGKE